MEGDKTTADKILSEIFIDFLKELEENEEVPDNIIVNIKNLWETDGLLSKEKILESIKWDDSNEN